MSWTDELSRLFQDRQVVRTRDVCAAGIPTMYLTRFVRDGTIRRVCHATYVPAGQAIRLETILREIAERMPHAIASLGTAAAVHGLERSATSYMSVTFPAGCKPPLRQPIRIEAFWERPRVYGLQARERRVGSTSVRVYGPEKTVTDFFKYRSRLGTERAAAVLDAYLSSEHRDLDVLADCARENRMARVMEPYLVAWTAFRGAAPDRSRRAAAVRGSRATPPARRPAASP